ncbi:probable palmitoyltransferase ZDHHC11 isoform X3 [Ailuropoda melanoleuca]|uniref:probable palmitoyltransferase ZDHHC11 isoform X3 n=1 Tax=Ailuropoda melanoleuca TaxID=9646 RepID=UPI000947CF3A|nr:probable palmitoyltransferase ZDHHC11 isoform X3 [Ailuropoda melanoleuca]
MDLCSRSWRWVVPEAKGKQAPPPRLSRVNGWSRPLHSFQVVAWAMLFIVAVANFGIFIPFLPRSWKYVAYGVTGGLFSLHFLVHLIAVSIDPAEANVRLKKNYPEPMPTFDRSKHTHVVQKQYCHLCEVTVSSKAKHCSACNKCVSGFDHHCKWLNNCVGSRNYWYFFLSVASAAAVLLCLIVTLLYIFIQFFTDPAELRTHPYYKKVSNKNTWLLFLPLFPVKTKTPVVLGIGVFVMLLDVISLLLLGHLLLFHLYLMAKKLSTYDYMTQGRQQQTPQASAEKEELSFQIRYPQQADNDQSSSEHREMLQPLRKCPSPCSTTAIHPENSLLPTSDVQGAPAARSAPVSVIRPPMPRECVAKGHRQQANFVFCTWTQAEGAPVSVQVLKPDLYHYRRPGECPVAEGFKGPTRNKAACERRRSRGASAGQRPSPEALLLGGPGLGVGPGDLHAPVRAAMWQPEHAVPGGRPLAEPAGPGGSAGHRHLRRGAGRGPGRACPAPVLSPGQPASGGDHRGGYGRGHPVQPG